MKFIAPKNDLIAIFLKSIFCLIAVPGFVFTANSQTAFNQQAKLTATDGANQDSHGFSVAISGDTAVVGATATAKPTLGFSETGSGISSKARRRAFLIRHSG